MRSQRHVGRAPPAERAGAGARRLCVGRPPPNTNYTNYMPYGEITRKLGHHNVALLKMDIEGHEFQVGLACWLLLGVCGGDLRAGCFGGGGRRGRRGRARSGAGAAELRLGPGETCGRKGRGCLPPGCCAQRAGGAAGAGRAPVRAALSCAPAPNQPLPPDPQALGDMRESSQGLPEQILAEVHFQIQPGPYERDIPQVSSPPPHPSPCRCKGCDGVAARCTLPAARCACLPRAGPGGARPRPPARRQPTAPPLSLPGRWQPRTRRR
jgi:hypothetical protein